MDKTFGASAGAFTCKAAAKAEEAGRGEAALNLKLLARYKKSCHREEKSWGCVDFSLSIYDVIHVFRGSGKKHCFQQKLL